jgi:hypothetical protein
MDERLTSQPKPRTAAEYRAAIDLLLDEMKRLSVQMQQDQAEIDRLKAETRVIAAHTDGVLARIEAQMQALTAAH